MREQIHRWKWQEGSHLLMVALAALVSWQTLAAAPPQQQKAKSPTSMAAAGPLTMDGPVKGSGTTNFIPIWTNSSTIGNSIMSQSSSTNVSVSGSVSATGNLTLGGSINNALTLQGNLSDSSGDQGANVIGGFGGNSSFAGNSVASGVLGATIAGGGGALLFGGSVVSVPNTVTADWGTVSGGQNNTAGSFAVVTGGSSNSASGFAATVAGGSANTASAFDATVAGGSANSASNDFATVAGAAKTPPAVTSRRWAAAPPTPPAAG